ncbi:maleylpyruvate isomerase family mycothiol-dependent enzyme [Amycolatopsis minnesotensis]|uniref:Maleylpyruvate isomerase family mycothiol-dependent enzyme n=1 Tax=Amycolatopsis minnesotensis TaxID=337894 RepID=A0ABP5BCH0_9PSEU
MDRLAHLRRDVHAFESAARAAADGSDAPTVPSCPGWTVSDLVAHLGWVHRYVTHIVADRLAEPPDEADASFVGLPPDLTGWPSLDGTPSEGPVPATLLGWFTEGAAALESAFRGAREDERVWSWADEHTVGFWLRIQAVEAAVHRWDVENAVTTARPIDAGLAADAISHNFEVMVPRRREEAPAEPGRGERYRFRATDRAAAWTVRFGADDVAFTDGEGDVELAGTASDLMLFLWHRIPADRLSVSGDQAVLDRYFALVPPA